MKTLPALISATVLLASAWTVDFRLGAALLLAVVFATLAAIDPPRGSRVRASLRDERTWRPH